MLITETLERLRKQSRGGVLKDLYTLAGLCSANGRASHA